MDAELNSKSFGSRVMNAVYWRSGSQLVAQLVMWASTFFVIRLLDPQDYGLYAMTQSVLVFLSLLNGQAFAGSLVNSPTIERIQVQQVFGLLIALNLTIALVQIAIAPLVAHYYHQPIVARMLAIQALLYLAIPFTTLPATLLSRAMDFRKQAKVNMASAAAGALASLVGALAGLGVWTLVFAPLAVVWTRAIGMTLAARMLVRPSFRFAGAGPMVRYGGAMLASSLLWLIQTQADVFVGGRHLDAHNLGLYTTALFLAQIVTSKFIPPLNDVAFTAYARLQSDIAMAARAFEKSVRLIMMFALPFYVGMALTADVLVRTVLGEKWIEAGPIVALLALVMPFLTLQVLFTPAATALGHPRIQVLSSAAGAVIMPIAFLIGVRHGAIGMAEAWLIAFPLLTCITAALAMPIIGTSVGGVLRAILPALAASTGMAIAVSVVDWLVPVAQPALRLGMLVATGAGAYGVLVVLFARPILAEMLSLIRMRNSVPL